MEGKRRTENILYKCIVSISGFPDKVYLGAAEGHFKKRYYNHISSSKNETQMNKTTLTKQRHNITPTLKWHIFKPVQFYSSVTKS